MPQGAAVACGRAFTAAAAVVVVALLTAGCGRGGEASRAAATRATAPGALTVRVLADTGRGGRLAIAAPPAVAVSLARVTPAAGGATVPPLPEARPESVAVPPATDVAAQAGERLLPPILRRPGTLVVPPGVRGGVVELDVLVDEAGRVADVRVATAGADTARLGAARRCAAAMEFYPARLGERTIAVWCRQRFEFGAP